MAKRSYQKGWLRPRGKKWYGYYEVKRLNPETGQEEWRTEAPIPLGLRSQMNKFQARDALATEIAKRTGTSSDGQMKLVGVEFITFAATWLKNNSSPPVLEGQVFLLVDSPNRFNIPSFFELHVWAWRDNPQGDFVDWNDDVSCAGDRAH